MRYSFWGMFKQMGFLSVCATVFMFGLTGCKKSDGNAAPPPPEVSVMVIKPERVEVTTELPGRPSAYRVAEIRPQVNGLIQKRLFTEGADVNSGETLYQIDPAPFQAALDNANASLARSQAGLNSIRLRVERYTELLTDKAVSQQDYDDAAASMKQAEADILFWKAMVETAKINLGYTKVTAPIPGRIGKSNVTDGALVTAYQPVLLATIQQLDPIYVDVPQSTAQMLRLKSNLEQGHMSHDSNDGKKVSLIMEDGKPYPQQGILQFRDITVDPTTGSVILRIVFPNPDGVLLPGMFVRVIVNEGNNDKAILIPQQSVWRDPKGNPMVFVVDSQDKIQQRMLSLDRAVGSSWVVSLGLAAGERIVTEGMQKIRHGVSVKAVPASVENKNVAENQNAKRGA